MNLKVLQWLLKYKRELLEVVAIAKTFRPDLPLGEKWRLVDEIAKILIPVIETETKAISLLQVDEDEISALSIEGEVNAMAIDWQLIIDVIIPIVISILQALAAKKE